jgi:hypothetical protein
MQVGPTAIPIPNPNPTLDLNSFRLVSSLTPSPTAHRPSDCASGKISSEARTSCTDCSAGTFVLNKTSCVDCPSGYYAPTAQVDKCYECSAGDHTKLLSKATGCYGCNSGTHSEALSVNCSECGAGRFSTSRSDTCTNCSSGSISTARSASCTKW